MSKTCLKKHYLEAGMAMWAPGLRVMGHVLLDSPRGPLHEAQQRSHCHLARQRSHCHLAWVASRVMGHVLLDSPRGPLHEAQQR